MNVQDLKLAAASDTLDPPALRAALAECLRELAEQTSSFAESLISTASAVEAADESLPGAALQIAIARRVLEEALAEAAEIFDVAVWIAGVGCAEEST